MKIFLFLITVLIISVACDICPQSTSSYRLFWDADTSGRVVSWNVYYEERPEAVGFILQDGVNRENTDLTSLEKQTGLSANITEIVVTLDNNGYFGVVGVESMDAMGTWADLGVSASPYKKGDSPPKAGGVGMEKLPD